MYALELGLHEMMLQSPHRTLDPEVCGEAFLNGLCPDCAPIFLRPTLPLIQSLHTLSRKPTFSTSPYTPISSSTLSWAGPMGHTIMARVRSVVGGLFVALLIKLPSLNSVPWPGMHLITQANWVATVFLLSYANCLADQHRIVHGTGMLDEAQHWIQSHYPYWDRKGGRDHIWVRQRWVEELSWCCHAHLLPPLLLISCLPRAVGDARRGVLLDPKQHPPVAHPLPLGPHG